MNNIINVIDFLNGLGESAPGGVWASIKQNEPAFNVLLYKDEKGNEYLSQQAVGYLKSTYQKLYETPNPSIVVAGKKFNSETELESYLKSILKSYKVEESLKGKDREILADLFSRSERIKTDIAKHGYVMDIRVSTKTEYKGKFFEVAYLNRTQMISIKNYLNPSPNKLINIWGE